MNAPTMDETEFCLHVGQQRIGVIGYRALAAVLRGTLAGKWDRIEYRTEDGEWLPVPRGRRKPPS